MVSPCGVWSRPSRSLAGPDGAQCPLIWECGRRLHTIITSKQTTPRPDGTCYCRPAAHKVADVSAVNCGETATSLQINWQPRCNNASPNEVHRKSGGEEKWCTTIVSVRPSALFLHSRLWSSRLGIDKHAPVPAFRSPSPSLRRSRDAHGFGHGWLALATSSADSGKTVAPRWVYNESIITLYIMPQAGEWRNWRTG